MNYLIKALLLSLERIFYYYFGHYPELLNSLKKQLGISPPHVIQKFCVFFKFIQFYIFYVDIINDLGGFNTCCYNAFILSLTLLMISYGQYLNYLVFDKLGVYGTFYGNVYGYDCRWVTEFPYSVFRHPQYVGVLLCIIGLYLPWYQQEKWFYIPLIEFFLYFSEVAFEFKLVKKAD